VNYVQSRIGTIRKALGFGALLLLSAVPALAGKTQNIVLIVSDGLRWQEVFTGADPALLNDKEGGSWLAETELRKRYWSVLDARRCFRSCGGPWPSKASFSVIN
jgi:hypothetical protein